MNDFTTESLIRIIEQQLTEWRRLPVKHPQQIASRDQVINAIMELKQRITTQEHLLQEKTEQFVSKSKEFFVIEEALKKQEDIHKALRRQLINADDIITDLRNTLNSLDKANKVFIANTRKIDAILNGGKETNSSLGDLIAAITLQHANHILFITQKERDAIARRAKGQRLKSLYLSRWNKQNGNEDGGT